LRPPSSVDGIEVVVDVAAPTASTPARAIVGNRRKEAALRILMIVSPLLGTGGNGEHTARPIQKAASEPGPLADNRQVVLNVVRWLSRVL